GFGHFFTKPESDFRGRLIDRLTRHLVRSRKLSKDLSEKAECVFLPDSDRRHRRRARSWSRRRLNPARREPVATFATPENLNHIRGSAPPIPGYLNRHNANRSIVQE